MAINNMCVYIYNIYICIYIYNIYIYMYIYIYMMVNWRYNGKLAIYLDEEINDS